jgi:hypothetical protein
MCVNCPALAGLDTEAFEPCGAAQVTITSTLKVDAGQSRSWWCESFSEHANEEAVGDMITVTLFGMPGQQFRPHGDSFVQAANDAVAQCPGPLHDAPGQDLCRAIDYGLEVRRKYERPIQRNQHGVVMDTVSFSAPIYKRT